MESAYGYYKGRFPVIQALTTLAYDPRRGDFFRTELKYALAMVDQKHIQLKDFKGEWAGGSGHPQFLWLPRAMQWLSHVPVCLPQFRLLRHSRQFSLMRKPD